MPRKPKSVTRARGAEPVPAKRKRRTKAELDPSILGKLTAIVSVGGSKQDAASYCRITYETFRQYEARGRRGEEPFASWLLELKAAQITTKVYMLGLIQKAAKGDWKAGAFLLQKLYRAQFGSTLKLEADLDVSGLDLSKLSVKDLLELKRLRGLMGDAAEGEDDERDD